MSSSILDRIAGKKAETVSRQKQRLPLKALLETSPVRNYSKRDFGSSIKNEGRASVIAEVKKASPSAGVIRKNFNPVEIIKNYEKSGADAISVITEEDFFLGSPDTLRLVKKLSGCPALMKDFIIDEYQLYAAASMGADCVLLIARLLPGGKLADFVCKAAELNMDSLVEVHDGKELDSALGAEAKIIGINNRNLETFEVDIRTTLDIAPGIPEGVIKVSESGISTKDDVKKLYSAGIDAVLIGEVLMRAEDPGAKLRELRDDED